MSEYNEIIRRCVKAGLSFWVATQVALNIRNKKIPISEEKLNDIIVGELNQIDPDFARIFLNYYNIKVRTSKGFLENFDKEKIVKSLVLETRIPRPIAEEIAKEVEEEIRRMQLSNINTSLIREIVNMSLLKRKLVEARLDYTRIGIPVYDMTQKIEQSKEIYPTIINRMIGNYVMREYVLTKIIPQNLAKEHLLGNIHIHGIEGFITAPFALKNDLRWFLKNGLKLDGSGKYISVAGPAKRADVVASHAARVMYISKDYVVKGVSFDYFNYFLAPYIENNAEQTIQTFLYELNQQYYTDPYLYSITLANELPKELAEIKAIGPGGTELKNTYEDYYEEANTIIDVFFNLMKKGDYIGNRFNWPHIVLKTQNPRSKEYPYSVIRDSSHPSYVYKLAVKHVPEGASGIMQVISINFPKIVYESEEDEEKIFEHTQERIIAAIEVIKLKEKIMKKRFYIDKALPFFTHKQNGKSYANLTRFYYMISYQGLPEGIMTLMGTNEFTNECLVFERRILRFTKKVIREHTEETYQNILLAQYKSESAANRFKDINRKLCGKTVEISGYLTPDMKESKRIKFEENLQRYCDSGEFFPIKTPEKLKGTLIKFAEVIE